MSEFTVSIENAVLKLNRLRDRYDYLQLDIWRTQKGRMGVTIEE
jgi:hypothetical protein